MDTVHPLGLFGTPPVKIKDGIIYGPGVSDCKGGIVASLLAMDALLQCGFTDRPLLLLLQSDEEISSMPNNKQTVRYMAEKAKDCVAFLNAEPFSPGKITVARKGILRYEFTVHGRSVHSSVCHKGASAIAEAAHKILALEQWKDPDGITCNCGVISGGTVGNTVPDTCTFIADIRYATLEQRETVEASVQKIASESSVEGTSCDLSLKSYRVPMERNEVNDALFARASEIFREAKLPDVIPWHSKGGSDASDLTAYGIPCLDSLGVPGAREHSHEEHAPLDGLVTSARMLAAIAYLI
jgi:glutamate carboxypeptidase